MAKLKIHTTEQPDSDTTTFILSCNRLEVLDKTLQSFLMTRDYVTKMVIVDDSAEDGVFETLVDRYGSFSDVVCFPRNRSQWWAMDFMVSYCDSEYIFYLEDDWELLKPGYLNASKQILQKYRDIGTVDISWRTFEWQGIDSYDKTLIDDMFYYKKLWRISDYHLHWYGWVGSPNLKRRDDLILLGRVEKWHNEWNIDRRFLGLGFKAVFLNGEYTRHLGDACSRMNGKRPNDGTTPEDYYPKELNKNRTYPVFDYLQWDKQLRHPYDITIVTALIDLNRNDRDFENHYLEGLKKIINTRHRIVVYAEEKYHDSIKKMRNDVICINFNHASIENTDYFLKVQSLISKDEWKNQAPWMKDSVIASKYYIAMTLMKQELLEYASRFMTSSYYYWVDSGMYNSYNITEDFNSFYFTKIPKDKFFITSFPYIPEAEIHGYSVKVLLEIPNYVCRATIFGGTKEQIQSMKTKFYEQIHQSLNDGYIGTEEAIFTILSIKYPEDFNRLEMPNGDIKNLLHKLR